MLAAAAHSQTDMTRMYTALTVTPITNKSYPRKNKQVVLGLGCVSDICNCMRSLADRLGPDPAQP